MPVFRDFLINLFAGFVADVSSPYGMIGALFSVGLMVYLVVGWHRKQLAAGKRGVDSWPFIALAFVVAAIAIGGGAYGLGVRSDSTSKSQGEVANQPTSLIKGYPTIERSDDGRISFRGIYARSGGELVVYVTYGMAGGAWVPQPPTQPTAVNNRLTSEQLEPRIKLDSVPRFDRGEQADVTVGHVTKDKDNETTFILQWGKPNLNNKKIGITLGNYFGWIIFVAKDGTENRYPFAIITRSTGLRNLEPPTIFGPPVIMSIMELGSNGPN